MNIRGFTLIELIIYIALASIITVMLATMNINILSNFTRGKTAAEVQRTYDQIIERLAYEVRRAKDLNLAASQFNITNSKLVLNMENPNQDPTIFEIVAQPEGNQLVIKQGNDDPIALSSDNITVDNFTIKNLSSETGSSKNISLSLDLRFINPDNLYDFEAIKSTITTFELQGTEQRCGNGFIEAGESCDDGNTNELDSCDSSCQINENPSWWNASWQSRRIVTLDTSVVTASLNNFPLLVKLSDSFDYENAQPDGQDIRFLDEDDTTLLDFEIEDWNDLNGDSYIWVNIPELKAHPDPDFIIMYYENPSATPGDRPTKVWDDNYRAVWHLNDFYYALWPHDSTVNGNNCQNSFGGQQTLSEGNIDGAYYYDGTANDYNLCNVSGSYLTDKLTISAWINWDGQATFPYSQDILSGMNYSGGGLSTYVYPSWPTISDHAVFRVKYSVVTSDNALAYGQWYYLVGTYDRFEPNDNIKFYVNGVLQSETADLTDPMNTYYGLWLLSYGKQSNYNDPNYAYYVFNGDIDEARISQVPRSSDWIAVEYKNQKPNSTFASIGAVNTVGS